MNESFILETEKDTYLSTTLEGFNKKSDSQKTAVVNSVEIHYEIEGDGLHVILCIPGAAAPCKWAFTPQLEYFGRKDSGYTIISYDPRGYGYSRPPDRDFQIHPEHHIKRDASDAYQLMTQLGFTRYSVLGWCSGGVTAICLAARYPTTIISLMVVGCRPYYTNDDISRIKPMTDITTWNRQLLETFTNCYGSVSQTEQLMKQILDSVIDTCNQTDGDMCSEEMTQVVCPALIGHGERDRITLRSHADYVHHRISNSELTVFEEAGHSPHQSCSDKFNSTVETFLYKYYL